MFNSSRTHTLTHTHTQTRAHSRKQALKHWLRSKRFLLYQFIKISCIVWTVSRIFCSRIFCAFALRFRLFCCVQCGHFRSFYRILRILPVICSIHRSVNGQAAWFFVFVVISICQAIPMPYSSRWLVNENNLDNTEWYVVTFCQCYWLVYRNFCLYARKRDFVCPKNTTVRLLMYFLGQRLMQVS